MYYRRRPVFRRYRRIPRYKHVGQTLGRLNTHIYNTVTDLDANSLVMANFSGGKKNDGGGVVMNPFMDLAVTEPIRRYLKAYKKFKLLKSTIVLYNFRWIQNACRIVTKFTDDDLVKAAGYLKGDPSVVFDAKKIDKEDPLRFARPCILYFYNNTQKITDEVGDISNDPNENNNLKMKFVGAKTRMSVSWKPKMKEWLD